MTFPVERRCFFCRKPFTSHELREIYCSADCVRARETQERESRCQKQWATRRSLPQTDRTQPSEPHRRLSNT